MKNDPAAHANESLNRALAVTPFAFSEKILTEQHYRWKGFLFWHTASRLRPAVLDQRSEVRDLHRGDAAADRLVDRALRIRREALRLRLV